MGIGKTKIAQPYTNDSKKYFTKFRTNTKANKGKGQKKLSEEKATERYNIAGTSM